MRAHRFGASACQAADELLRLEARVAELADEIARLQFDLENATESRKLAQQALYDARERFQKEVLQRTAEVSRLLKERQDCEPVAWMSRNSADLLSSNKTARSVPVHAMKTPSLVVPLYAAPPKREPLSEDEIKQIEFTVRTYKREPLDVVAFASAIERAHGIGGQS